MTIETRPVTAEELLRMPEDGFRYELVKEELRKTVPAGSEHGYAALKLGRLLGNHVEECMLGRVYDAETGIRISSNPDTVRATRCGFRELRARREGGAHGGYWPGAPTWRLRWSHSTILTPGSQRRLWRSWTPAAARCWSQTRYNVL